MRRILITAVLAGALAQAGAASAGCMATVGLAPPPAGIAPGTTWTAELTVLQHGANALPNASTARPTLTIVNTETNASRTFAARGTKELTRPTRESPRCRARSSGTHARAEGHTGERRWTQRSP